MAYLLDANVFIQAKRLHYGMDFCPAFWDWLCEQNQAGKVFSIEKVADELAAGASLVMGQAAQACPVVLARGAGLKQAEGGSGGLIRDKATDMFR